MYIVLIVLVVSLVNVFLSPDTKSSKDMKTLPYSAFISEVNSGNVQKVEIDNELNFFNQFEAGGLVVFGLINVIIPFRAKPVVQLNRQRALFGGRRNLQHHQQERRRANPLNPSHESPPRFHLFVYS